MALSINDAAVALSAQGVVRFYNKHEVLKGINMSLPQGKILGLLGPSGCGKTTFLKCVVGRLYIHGGKLDVLGRAPCSDGHAVPGRLVGYMPQETALYSEFTVYETLQYCAKLFGMSNEAFEKRKDTLLNLLEMQALEHRLISQLSGGQKRRASFAVAMIHDPQLLILDEPTVGVDPLLRAKLWEHLVMLARDTGVTIVITTHYIEEARQADLVCLMREGRILVQDSPNALIARYQMETLEDVFLELCRRQTGHTQVNNTHQQPIAHGTSVAVSWADTEVHDEEEERAALLPKALKRAPRFKCERPQLPRVRNVGTIFWKNLTRLRRNIGLLLFSFFIPSIQVIFYFLAIGRDPKGLHMAVVNMDVGYTYHDMTIRVSDMYLSYIDSSTIIQDPVSSYQEALSRVEHGQAWGIYQFGTNFSQDLILRYISKDSFQEKALLALGGQIQLSLDFSNQQIAIAIEQCTSDAIQAMAAGLLGPYVALATPPLHILPPIYGPPHPTFTNFVAPGIIVTICFAQAIALTAVAFVTDRKEGLLDRTWAMGVVPSEVILGHTLTQILIIAGQVTLMLIFSLLAFELPMCGSLGLVILLMGLLGLTGMLYGLTISTISPEETHAMQLALGSFFPVLLLSGVIWPLEAIPTGLNYISRALPTTWAAEAMRSVMLRGWGGEHEEVWAAMLVILAWILLFLLASVSGIRRIE